MLELKLLFLSIIQSTYWPYAYWDIPNGNWTLKQILLQGVTQYTDPITGWKTRESGFASRQTQGFLSFPSKSVWLYVRHIETGHCLPPQTSCIEGWLPEGKATSAWIRLLTPSGSCVKNTRSSVCTSYVFLHYMQSHHRDNFTFLTIIGLISLIRVSTGGLLRSR
jgi:hypothetical protein